MLDSSRIIINADDFGFDADRNAAIIYCLHKNIISSTTIMVNCAGFEEAVGLAKKYEVTNKIGIHLNLTFGKPLTNLTGTGLIDGEGNFIKKSLFNGYMFISSSIKRRVLDELNSQYDKLEFNKIDPTHIDSHHSIHTNPWLCDLFVGLAKKRGKKLRIIDDSFRKNLLVFCYAKFINYIYKRNKVHLSDKIVTVSSCLRKSNIIKNDELSYEIVVHPSLQGSQIIDTVDNTDLVQELRQIRKLLE